MEVYDDKIGKPFTKEQRAAFERFAKDVLDPLFDDPESQCSRWLGAWHSDDPFADPYLLGQACDHTPKD